jgi:hypothetical protein
VAQVGNVLITEPSSRQGCESQQIVRDILKPNLGRRAGGNRIGATLKARGVVFRGDIIDDTQLLVANFQDPDGNPFYLAEPKAEYQRKPQPALNEKS